MDNLVNFVAVLILVTSLFFIMSWIVKAKGEYDIIVIIHRKRLSPDVTIDPEGDRGQ